YLVKTRASKKIKPRSWCLYNVISHSAADDVAQIEMLKRVILKIRKRKHEQLLAHVQIPANPTANRMRRRTAYIIGCAFCVDRVGIDRKLVALRDTRGLPRQRICQRL